MFAKRKAEEKKFPRATPYFSLSCFRSHFVYIVASRKKLICMRDCRRFLSDRAAHIQHSFIHWRNLVSSHSEMRVWRSQLRSDFKLELWRKTFAIAEIIFTRLFSCSRNRSRWEKYFLSCFKLIASRYAKIVEDLKCRWSSTVINCWEQIAF